MPKGEACPIFNRIGYESQNGFQGRERTASKTIYETIFLHRTMAEKKEGKKGG